MASILDINLDQREILQRIVNAQEKVQQRLLRVTGVLNVASIPYAVIGGNAVAAWVATRDEMLVRATRDVDLLVRPSDFDRIKALLESHGYTYRHVAEMEVFLEASTDKVGDAVHIIFAGQRVRPEHLLPAPEVGTAVIDGAFKVLPLEDLVRTKLVAWRDKDRVHLRDLIDVGLIDSTWPEKLDEPLSGRLSGLIENPEG